jgi:tripartite-type tricarboxylate transporter receptor subunit TctC
LAIFVLLAPAGTPEPIIAKLHREAVRILALPDVRKRFDELDMVPMGTSPRSSPPLSRRRPRSGPR